MADPVSSLPDPVLSLSEVRLTLAGNAGPVEILKGVSLEVNRGETVALTGASGSGKSSLMMVMAGLERPSAGSVTVLGRDLATLDEDALARFRAGNVGIVFQSFHLIPTMTALENVLLPLELAGRRGADALAGARDALAAVGLAGRARHYPGEMSGGEQQRTALARALAPGPALLLADEPTGNLDAESGARVIELMFALRARHGTTLLLVTHDPALASRCGRILRLHDGRLVGEPEASPVPAPS